MIDSLDAYGKVLGLFVLVFGRAMFGSKHDYEGSSWYRATAGKVRGVPPSWIFSIVWMLLYGALFTSHVLFLVVYEAAEQTGNYAAYFSMALTNAFLLHTWTNVFTGPGYIWKWVGVVDAIIALGSVVGLIVVAALEHRWVVWVLHIPLGLWLLYVTYLSFMFAIRYSAGRIVTKRN